MKSITVRYGLQSNTFDFPDNFNVGQVVRDPRVRAQMGYGDNITVTEDGVSIPMDQSPCDGSELHVETAANRKALPTTILKSITPLGYFVPLGVPQHV